jgi:hypothetical protein
MRKEYSAQAKEISIRSQAIENAISEQEWEAQDRADRKL